MTTFLPHQIVCLDYEETHLYAEVIQIVTDRGMGWLRPLMLLKTPAAETTALDGENLEDGWLQNVQASPDLLWPLNQLRVALDMEVIPLVTALQNKTASPAQKISAHQAFTQHLQHLWLRHCPSEPPPHP